jgi:hypothetical protein
MTTTPKSLAVLATKGIFCGLVYVMGTILTGMLAAALRLSIPNLTPPGISQAEALRGFVLASALLGLAMTPLARGVHGGRIERWLSLAFLPFICLAVNAVIEILIFTTMLTRPSAPSFVASFVLPTLLFGASLAFLAKSEPGTPKFSQQTRVFFSTHSAGAWVWRLLLAILAFPVIYFVFGAMVAPFVVPAYRAGVAGLVLPPLSAIMPMQLVRSTLFLLASLPFLIMWKGGHRSLILSLGLAHCYLVGLFGLLQASFLPQVLRLAHSVEIAADSFAYATVLVFLFFSRPSQNSVPVPVHTAPLFPS